MTTHTHTHTHTHKVNSLDEILTKAKEYKSQEDKWKLISNYHKVIRRNNIAVGIVIGNTKGETAEIYAEFSELNLKSEIYDKFTKELLNDLFPIETKPSKADNQEKEKPKSQEPKKEEANNSSPYNNSSQKGNDNKLTTGLIIGGLIFSCLLLTFFFCLRKRKKK
ncbi:MAG: hypothetical protein MRECE_20c017 [Mycoplasmataceae bacterium CE_OT135]|nr:MAG: hypothetical protein MRECE_20c017 [Mycoplasmataceae bacterium CE_OT135]